MRDYQITKVVIEDRALSLLPRGVVDRLQRVFGIKSVVRRGDGTIPISSFEEAKQTLVIREHPESLLKPCPGTGKGYLCCGYMVVNQPIGCPLDCNYCVLQSYLGLTPLTLWANSMDLYSQLQLLRPGQPGRSVRIGNGELADSLALDYVTGLSSYFVEQFGNRDDVVFEFKTKTDEIDGLLQYSPPPNIVVSWSMNPSRIAVQEHSSCPPLGRIRAAGMVQRKGYTLAFHFDPIVFYEGWEQDYEKLVESIFNTIDGSGIIWISLGTLRFPPGLREIVRDRFVPDGLLCGEMIRGTDGKMRYLKPLRVMLLRKLYKLLKPRAPRAFFYMCMESEDVWRRVMGFAPRSNAHLCRLLEEHSHAFITFGHTCRATIPCDEMLRRQQ